MKSQLSKISESNAARFLEHVGESVVKVFDTLVITHSTHNTVIVVHMKPYGTPDTSIFGS